MCIKNVLGPILLFGMLLSLNIANAQYKFVTSLSDTYSAGELRYELENAVNNDTILINVSGVVMLSNTINVNSSIVVIGPSPIHFSVDASGVVGSAFILASTGYTEINGITIENGANEAITINSGNVSINRCVLKNNNGGSGGAVYNSSVSKFSSCSFMNNFSGTGGAVYNAAGSADFINCTFYGNQSSAHGGAIYNIGSSTILNLYNNTFYGNTAANLGGAVQAFQGNITIRNNIFNENIQGSGPSLNNTLGVYFSEGGNVFSDISIPPAVTTPLANDKPNVNPLLYSSPWVDGYGLEYFPISSNLSQAIDIDNLNASISTYDARKSWRQMTGISNYFVDAGAVEYSPNTIKNAVDWSTVMPSVGTHGGNEAVVFEFNSTLPQSIPSSSTFILAGANPTIINGFSQKGSRVPGPGANVNTVTNGLTNIMISSQSNNGYALEINSDYTVIAGLSIVGFNIVGGLKIVGAMGTEITGCHIGVDTEGDDVISNLDGVFVTNGSSYTQIGICSYMSDGIYHNARNVISGNTNTQLYFEQPTNTKIGQNFIGLSSFGTDVPLGASPNTGIGIKFWDVGGASNNNLVGGDLDYMRNVISGQFEAMLITTGKTVVLNNYFGTDLLGNSGTPSLSNTIGINIEGSTANNNMIGTPYAGNVIGNFTDQGILCTGSINSIIQSNLIGIGADGTSNIGNGMIGIKVWNGSSVNKIGGCGTFEGNIIGYCTNGIQYDGASSYMDSIMGNWVGIDQGGNPAPNNYGVAFLNGASDVIVGDTSTGCPNEIANSTNIGTGTDMGGSTGIVYSGNSIHNNGGAGVLGIDLDGAGPNLVQGMEPSDNFGMLPPLITSVFECGGSGQTSISFQVNNPNMGYPYLFEFFLADSDNEEGQTFLGSYYVSSFINSTDEFVLVLPGPALATGLHIVGTATHVEISGKNTSEFSASHAVTIPPPAPAVSSSATSMCEGAAPPMLTTSGYYGVPVYYEDAALTIRLDSGQFYTPTNITTAGVYTYYVVDSLTSCSSPAGSVSITVNSLPLPAITGAVSACTGTGETYMVSAYPSTDWALYTQNGSSSTLSTTSIETVSMGSPGIDTLVATVIDVNGCLNRDSVFITINPNPSIATFNLTLTDASCNGVCDGTAIYGAPSGPPETWAWDGGVAINSNSATGLCAGTHTVVYTDINGCSDNGSFNILEPPVLNVNVSASSSVVCQGQSVTLYGSASGGTPSYTGSWDNGVIDGVAFVPAATNTYTYTSVDATGCSANNSVNVTVNPLPTALNQSQQFCSDTPGGNTHTIDLITTFNSAIDGGVGNVIQWYSDAGCTVIIATPGAYPGVGSQTLYATVTDAGGCTDTAQVIVNVISSPDLTTFSAAITNPSCPGNFDGSIVYAGAPTGNWFLNSAPASSSMTGLGASTYEVIFEDLNACRDTIIHNLVDPVAMNLSFSKTDVLCFGGATGDATVSVTGGTPTYTYQWDANTGNQTTPTATGLVTGTYSVSVMDANGCSINGNITINQPAAAVAVTVGFTDVTCNGAADGQITLTGSGGDGNYVYSIDNGTTYGASSIFTNQPPGTYNAIIMDGAGCTSGIVPVTINEPPLLAVTVVGTTNVSCFGASDGTIDITPGGGIAPYVFDWDYDGTGDYDDPEDLNGLAGGTYSVLVQDNNGCITGGSGFVMEPSNALSFTYSSADDTCSNGMGQISMASSGGTSPYLYSFDGGVTFVTSSFASGFLAGIVSVTTQDNNGCIASSQTVTINNYTPVINVGVTVFDDTCGLGVGQILLSATGGTPPHMYSIDNGVSYSTNSAFTGLATGSYDVIVTDNNGCTSVLQTHTLNNVGAPIITLDSIVSAKCFGSSDGAVYITVSGGNPAYTFSWNGGAYISEDLSNVPTGTYDLLLSDASGCSATLTGNFVSEPTSVIASPVVGDISCNGAADGQINVTASGGTGSSYQYSIDNGTTFQPSGAFGGQLAGSYNVQAMDGAGCLSSIVTVGINEPALLAISSWSVTNISCFGGNDGSATALGATGGTQPYSYQWYDNISGNPVTGQVDTVANSLTAGMYYILVTDNNNCTAQSTSVSVIEPAEIVTNITSVDPLCFGSNDGSVTVDVTSGGTAPFSFSNDGVNYVTGSQPYVFGGLISGNYNVSVSDANGCISTNQLITLSDPAQLVLTLTATDETCFGAADGAVVESVSGGSGTAYQISRNGAAFFTMGSNPQTLAGLSSGYVHNVVVQDVNGCLDSATVTIGGGTQISFNVTGISDTCSLGIGAVQFSNVTGGTSPYGYSLNGTINSLSSIIEAVAGGVYTAGVMDVNGCSQIQSVTVGDVIGTIPPEYAGVNNHYKICPGTSTDIEAFGGDSYGWINTNNIDTNTAIQTVAPDSSTYYFVNIYLGSCYRYDSTFVEIVDSPDCAELDQIANNVFTPDGDQVNDLFILDIEHLLVGNENTVTIFNRWGDEINSFINYNNDDVAWDGKNKSGIYVTNGTYFYIVEIPAINYSNSGWVQVVR